MTERGKSAFVPRVVDVMAREILAELDLTRSIGHPGESGRAREQIITRFLERLLPDEFGVSSGFVIDGSGAISRQVDVVIYRKSYHPVLMIGGVRHFLVESVAAVIEVKANITSRAVLMEALENIESVKRLDRTGGGNNYTLPYGSAVDPDEFQFQVFGAIVTEQSLASDTLGNAIADFISVRSRRLWPNLYVDVHRLTYAYRPPGGGIGAVPMTAEALVRWEGDRSWSPLLELAYEVVNFLRVVPLVDFAPTSYFGAGDAGTMIGIDVTDLPRGQGS